MKKSNELSTLNGSTKHKGLKKMSMGLGHKYWVHLLKHHYGNLESCIEFMNKNKPINNKKWFELVPMTDTKNGTCDEYRCDLVELDK